MGRPTYGRLPNSGNEVIIRKLAVILAIGLWRLETLQFTLYIYFVFRVSFVDGSSGTVYAGFSLLLVDLVGADRRKPLLTERMDRS